MRLFEHIKEQVAWAKAERRPNRNVILVVTPNVLKRMAEEKDMPWQGTLVNFAGCTVITVTNLWQNRRFLEKLMRQSDVVLVHDERLEE